MIRAGPAWAPSASPTSCDNDPGVHKKVAMFCTGGIRCEKASAFMLKEGFAEVYHLQGGSFATVNPILVRSIVADPLVV